MKLLVPQILLIDDDKSTNFFNKIIIEKHGSFDKVSIVDNGITALEYFKAVGNNLETKPNIIFLDINMPGMNGWEFLKEFEKLGSSITENIAIFMLTTSCDEKEIEKSKKHKLVSGFLNKPLSYKLLDDVLEKYFCITT